MKRYGFLFQRVISMENLSVAFDKATKGKKTRDYIQTAIQNKELLLQQLYCKFMFLLQNLNV